MPWVRLDDHFDENPKVLSVGPLGLALWVTSIAYSNRNGTDGFIPTPIALRLISLEFEHPRDGTPMTALLGGARDYDETQQVGTVPDGYYLPNMLVAAGLWEKVAGGFIVHDYHDYQPTKEKVEADREAKREAGRAGGKASGLARAQASAKQTGSENEADASAKGQAETKPVPVPVPTASNEAVHGAKAPRSRKPVLVPLTDEEREKLIAKWGPKIPNVEDVIALSLEHEAHLKYPTGQYRYVDNWCRREAERFGPPAAPAAVGPLAVPAAAVQPWLQPGAREAADEARRQRIESRPADWYEKERERELKLARGET